MKISTDRIPRTELSTWHSNGPFPIELMYRAQQKGEVSYDLHYATVIEIQGLLKECLEEGKRFRAIGSRWSLNDIAFNGSRIHANAALDIRLPITSDQLHLANQTIKYDNLVFSQCGATVNQLNVFLEDRQKSLKTCGGSNGQTIAGVISTGVHGSGLERQCMSDYVRGMHLIIGPEENDRVYIERDSEPILNDEFVTNQLRSRVIRNDALFNAALVGLGSFGFIAAVVLEVEDIYSLKRYIKPIEYKDAIQLLQTLDFKNSAFQVKEELNDEGEPIIPYHFKPYINQYTKKNTVAEVIYKIPYQAGTRSEYDIATELHPDMFSIIHWALEKSEGKLTRLITKLLQGQVFPDPKKEIKPVIGTLGDIFHPVDFDSPGFSWAIAVDHSKISDAMAVFCGIFKNHKVPGLSAIKLVQQTKSTLGFTRFPLSAVIGLDGIQWNPFGDLRSQEEVEQVIIETFVNAGIEFTVHWGKNTDWNRPDLVKTMYGNDKVNEWKLQRNNLLRPEMMEVFDNDFLQRVGLNKERIA
ncbi:FAD-binding protein [Fulvivirga sp. M361]|uniref:FAD-binding protein n=1 Tax=Fulvivirga sp. M361 TaxID=2594266 RepID=UPI00117A9C22|nr:FAD-binding protein [Fulvivirga sp. M361]TRX54895.1 FAD-binding protein [Fulvivirga sp. M361]